MAKDTVTIRLSGELTLEDFARAVRRFTDLVAALSHEIPGADRLEWVLADLSYGSAIAVAETRPKDGAPWSQELKTVAESLTHSYLEVGTALEAQEPIPFSRRIAERAQRVQELTQEAIESITFETWEDDATIERTPEPYPLPERARAYAYGAVEGRVQALTSRGSLRFTLYDTLHDRAVSCYMAEGHEDQMKDVWGRIAVVEGWVRRHPRTGRPLTARNIRNIVLLAEPVPGIHRRARGAGKREGDQIRAEDAIRRVRDA